MIEKFLIENGVRRSATEVKCDYCEKIFLKINKYIKKSKKNFCSRDCCNLYQKNSIEMKCDFCKKQIMVKKSRLKKSKSGYIFCTLVCRNKAQSLSGIPEFTPSHYGKSKKNQKRNCEICKKNAANNTDFCPTHKRNRKYDVYIKLWKEGVVSGNHSDNENLSMHVRKYIFIKYNTKCHKCGWCEINTKSGKTPLTINHIDGNSSNSTEDNLELLCPNCHALTHNYGNLNKGNGRKSRRVNSKK
jgi:hypothetical protein